MTSGRPEHKNEAKKVRTSLAIHYDKHNMSDCQTHFLEGTEEARVSVMQVPSSQVTQLSPEGLQMVPQWSGKESQEEASCIH